jgi:hypothetical protein
MRSFEIKMLLEKVLKRLEVIDAKVSGMPSVQVQFSSTFLPTVNALTALGSASATQVSRVTGRSRAFESKQLNELKAMGIVSKQAQGRTKVFAVKQDFSAIPQSAPVLEAILQKTITN